MRPFRSTRRPRVRITLTAAALSAVVALVLSTASNVEAAPGSAAIQPPTGTKPTVVLVHGAFAGASGWTGVTQRLQRKGYTVIAPANPFATCRTTRPTSPVCWPPSQGQSS